MFPLNIVYKEFVPAMFGIDPTDIHHNTIDPIWIDNVPQYNRCIELNHYSLLMFLLNIMNIVFVHNWPSPFQRRTNHKWNVRSKLELNQVNIECTNASPL